jgi:hypothetical protein
LRSSLSQAFNNQEGAPAAKSQKTQAGKAAASGSDCPVKPFTPAQSDWLQKTLGSALAVFGDAVETRVIAVEELTNKMSVNVLTMDERLAVVEIAAERQKIEMQQLKEDMETKLAIAQRCATEVVATSQRVEQEIKDVKQQIGSGSGSGSGTSSARPASVPYEMRQCAIIGSLGWDTEAETLLKRAMEVIQAAGIAENEYHSMQPVVARSGKGSACECWFNSPLQLQQAKSRVRAAAKKYDDRRDVWLDARKTREEMQPARMVHRIHEVLQDLAAGRSAGRWTMQKSPGARTVSVSIIDNPNTIVMARVMNGKIRWQPWGLEHLTEHERVTAEEFAMDQ